MNGIMHLATAASASLAAAIWQGLVLTACVWLALRLLPRVSPAARSVVWLCVFVLTAALAFVPRGVHGTAVSASGAAFRVDARWALALLCCWAVFSAWAALRLLRGGLQLQRIARAAQAIPAPAACADLLGGGRAVTLCVSAEVEVPSVAGFFRPRILLPDGLIEKISADDLRQIVLHEMEHLRRRDDWTNLLQKIALVMCPLNPVLVWLERRLCLERELACDDGVLRAAGGEAGSGKAYATCLTNLAEQTMLRRGLALAQALVLGAWQRQSELARRVHRILLPVRPAGSARAQSVALAGMMTAACASAALVLAHTPLNLSFEAGAAPTVAAAASGEGAAMRRSAGAVQETLVKAVMPAAPPLKAKRVHRAVLVRRRALLRAAIGPPSQVVLIGWHDAPMTATRAVYFAPAAGESLQFTYAAVPVRNGWLILQM